MFRLFRKHRPIDPAETPRAPATAARMIEIDGDTMGTTYQVRIATARPLSKDEVAARVHAAVDTVDQQMSTWQANSDLSRFNASGTDAWVSVPRDLARVVQTGLAISKETRGAFDMTVGAAVNAWGFGPDGPARMLPDRPRPGAWQYLDACADPPALRKRAEMYVDLSGIAKGFGVDRICSALEDLGLTDYLVSIDGEARVSGRKPGVEGHWRIALDAPVDSKADTWDVLEPRDCAIATSGDYRHYFDHDGQRYAHTIDPHSGMPVQGGAASVTVMMPQCMLADAWATALLVMGPQRGVAIAQARNLKALFLFHDGPGFREVATGGILD